MYCRNCGKEVNEKAKVCLGCGVHPLLENKHCPNCGAPTQANQIMCVKCGVGLATTMSEPNIVGNESGVHYIASGAQKAIRIGVVLAWVIGIIGIISSVLLQDSLPTSLQNWLIADSERDLGTFEAVILPFGIVAIFSYIVASIGLFMLKRWGARLYLISYAVLVFLNFFTGPSVEHSLPASLAEISDILIGMVLGLAFFSDALNPKRQTGPTTL